MTRSRQPAMRMALIGLSLLLAGFSAACGSSSDVASDGGATSTAAPTSAAGDTGADAESSDGATTPEAADPGESSTFSVEVWADNWMAVYVNDELIGEDSVPITTERSFNSETFTFEATYPFTIGIEAKDFKETDSGIEYIGLPNQQIGDGGLIAQVTDTASGELVATTGSDWSVLVVQRAPLNPDCVNEPDPDDTCEQESFETPDDWAAASFDDSSWAEATEWTAEQVSPKDGYGEINWDDAARFIWGSDLEIDNTILMRTTVESG